MPHVVDDNGYWRVSNEGIKSLKFRHINQKLDMPSQSMNALRKFACSGDHRIATKHDIEPQAANSESIQSIEFFIAAIGSDDGHPAEISSACRERIDKAAVIETIDARLHQDAAPETHGFEKMEIIGKARIGRRIGAVP